MKSLSKTTAPEKKEKRPERDFIALILALVLFLKQLMERRALGLMEKQCLEKDQVARVGQALINIEQVVNELKESYELDDEEINLDLGDFGKLI